MDNWDPLFISDFNFSHVVNPLDFIRLRVSKYNESYDMFIHGMRGVSKSSTGLSLAMYLNPKLRKMDPVSVLDNCWAFTTKDRNEKNKKAKRGDVIVHDEQGTQESGSSYDTFKGDNKDFADEIQLNRTDGVINIGISTDQGRVIKRVRNLYRVDVFPIQKLSNKETGGKGLYTKCLIRFNEENPFAKNDTERIIPKYFRYDENAKIRYVLVPHPPVDVWQVYSNMRSEFREQIRSKNITKGKVETNTTTEILGEILGGV